MTKIPLKPQNETFTDTQWQAIFDKGDNLLDFCLSWIRKDHRPLCDV